MIVFHNIRWKNFLATGNYFIEINLDQRADTLFVGKNGSGKSTVLDAICFVLFGKAYRNINKPTVVNSINQNNCVVEIEFSIGKKKYKVIRGLKPNIFAIYCDGELINQESKNLDYQAYLETTILKMNYKSFTQIVVLGSASFKPFMQLVAAERRAIIEDLLDIQIFSAMNKIAKDKLSVLKVQHQELKYQLDLTEHKVKLQKDNIDEHIQHSTNEIDTKNTEITHAQHQIIDLQDDIELIGMHINILQQKISDKTTVETKSKKLIQLEAKMDNNSSKLQKDIDFFTDHRECPTCSQVIDESFRNDKLVTFGTKKTKLQEGIDAIKKQIKEQNDRLVEISKINYHITQHNSEIVKHNSTIASINSHISKLNEDIQKISNRKDNIEDLDTKLKEFNATLDDLKAKEEEMVMKKHYYEHALIHLKDNGIKTKIIKKYLPKMNKLINKYLADLDLFVNFNIDENFEETIKSRYRDEFTYNHFSEGQKQRIDLALLFTWRDIAKIKNSTSTNLLILDEVFDSSLDNGGIDLLMALMKILSQETNIIVMTQKGDQLMDKFKNVIAFELRNDFSYVV